MNTARRLWDFVIFTVRYYRRLRVNGWRRIPALSRALEAATLNAQNPDATSSHLPPVRNATPAERSTERPVDNQNR